jgi:membrane protease YdiL (CAAX protease family)
MGVKKVYIGFTVAAVFWFAMFFAPIAEHLNFWAVMTVAAGTLTTFSLLNDRKEIKKYFDFTPKYLLIGIIAAALLYGVFFAGNVTSNWLFDFSRGQVSDIHSIKDGTSKIIIGLLLLLWIGPAEEIFWRGFAQKKLAARFGDNAAMWIVIAVYAFVHIWSFNFMLFMAALICGIFWGYMYKRFNSVVPGIISHAIWDVAIFILIPIG